MEPIELTIRAKSSAPLRRGGLNLAPIGQWHLHKLPWNEAGAAVMLALVTDPAITVQAGEPQGRDDNGVDLFVWHDMPSADVLQEQIALFTVHDDDEPMGLMPAAGPTLEREEPVLEPQTDTKPPRSVGGEGAEGDQLRTPESAQNAAEPGTETNVTEEVPPRAEGEGAERASPGAETSTAGAHVPVPALAVDKAKAKAKAKPKT